MAKMTNGLSPRKTLYWGVFIVLVAVALLSLSAWQWSRAEEKVLWLQQQRHASVTQTVWQDGNLSTQWRAGENVQLVGRFDPSCRVALDNQPALGQTGYQLHQLFRLEGGKQAILVNLGWLPSDRQQGPPIPTALSEQFVVVGDVQKPVNFFTAGDAELLRGVWRVGRIELAEWQRRCQVTLLPWVVRLSPKASVGYHRDWLPTASQQMGPERHRAYAFQWFALAVTWCLCWWRLQRRSTTLRQPPQKQKGSARWVVIALLLSFVLPFAIGQLAYERHWVGGGATNKGELLTPPLDLLRQLQVNEQTQLSGRWWLGYVVPAVCEASCVQSLQTLPRLQATLGRERSRVGLLLIRTESSANVTLPTASADIQIITVQQQRLIALGMPANAASPWWIMDPLGWVMLRYRAPITGAEALSRAQILLDDLKQLLKASRIG